MGASLTGDTADTIHDIVDHLLANGIVATSVVVGSILFAADQHLRVEEGAVAAGADLVDGGGVEIDEERTGDMLAAAGLSEEGLKRARVANVLGVGVRTTISAEAMLQKGLTVGKARSRETGGQQKDADLRTSATAATAPGWMRAVWGRRSRRAETRNGGIWDRQTAAHNLAPAQ